MEDDGDLRFYAVNLIQNHIAALHQHLDEGAQLKVGAVVVQGLAAQQINLVHVTVALDTGEGLIKDPADRIDKSILAGTLLAHQTDVLASQVVAQAARQIVILRALQE